MYARKTYSAPRIVEMVWSVVGKPCWSEVGSELDVFRESKRFVRQADPIQTKHRHCQEYRDDRERSLEVG